MILSYKVSGKLSWSGALTMALLAVIALPYWSLAQSANPEPEPVPVAQNNADNDKQKVSGPSPLSTPQHAAPSDEPENDATQIKFTPSTNLTLSPEASHGNGPNSGKILQRVQTWAIRTKLDHVNGLLKVPHLEGRDWQWNDMPELVVQSFLRKDETVHMSSFVPAANGVEDVRPDSPSLRTFRTVNNLVGFYLLEHNDQTNDSFSLRIVQVANDTQPLADIDFDGVTVSGKHGAAVKTPGSSRNSASTLPPNFEALLLPR